MSDIRMQSIFLDEEFIYEDNSDVRVYNANRKNFERNKAEMGHAGKHGSNIAKRDEAEERSTSTRSVMNKQTANHKRLADQINNSEARSTDRQEKRNAALRNLRKTAKHESALMDMIEII